MHEVGLAQELVTIIEDVARRHAVHRVAAATLALGEISCVSAQSLVFAFELCSRQTVAEGCELRIERVGLTISCPSCGRRGPGDRELLGCPECHHTPVEVIAGREMKLLSIDAEDDINA